MDYITFQDSSGLQRILNHKGQTKDEFESTELQYLLNNGWISDSSDEWSRTLGGILDEEVDDFKKIGISLLILGTNDLQLVNDLHDLKIVGKGDCPECGGEMEHQEIWEHNEKWMEKKCWNCNLVIGTPNFNEAYEDKENARP